MEGYVKLYRSSLKDQLYFKEVFTKWQAWCDLILMAYHSPSEFFVRSINVKAKRGCVYMSVKKLGDRWRWSRSKVERFLKYLETDGRIKVKASNVVNCISILNYEKFQSSEPPNELPTERTKKPPTELTYKNVKKNVKNMLFPESLDSDAGEGILQQILSQMQELKERLDAQEQMPRKSNKKKEPNQLITKGREVFENIYTELFSNSYYWVAKDSVAMDALTKKIVYSRKKKGMSVEVEDVLKALKAFLESIKDDWILNNFSVTNINSKYNEIVAQARAVRQKKNGSDTNSKMERAAEAASIIARLAEQEESDVCPIR